MVRLAPIALLVFAGLAFGDVKSGIAVGESVKAFNPQNVTGPDAGKAACLVCANGESPVIAVFARELDEQVTALIKAVDAAAIKHKKAELGAFAVMLEKSEDMERRARSFSDKEGIRRTIIALEGPAGPKGYNIAKDANVTLLLYVGRKVKVNFAFEKGKLTAAEIEKVMKELPKILE